MSESEQGISIGGHSVEPPPPQQPFVQPDGRMERPVEGRPPIDTAKPGSGSDGGIPIPHI